MYRTFEVRSGRQVVARREAVSAREALIEYLLGLGCRRDELVSMGGNAVSWRGAVFRAEPAAEQVVPLQERP